MRARAPAAPATSGASFRRRLAADLAELRAEQASADRRTQSRLLGLQEFWRNSSHASPPSRARSQETSTKRCALRDGSPRELRRRQRSIRVCRGLEALGPEIAPQRSALDQSRNPLDAEDNSPLPPLDAAGISGRARRRRAADARARRATLRRSLDPKTSPAVSAHIAAARRAAQAALAEHGGRRPDASDAEVVRQSGPSAACRSRGPKREGVLLQPSAGAVLLGAALADRRDARRTVVGVRASFCNGRNWAGRRSRPTKAETPPDRSTGGAIKSIGRAIDAAPTGSIAPAGPNRTLRAASRAATPSASRTPLHYSRPEFPSLCATPSLLARQGRSTSWRSAFMKAAARPRISRPRPFGLSAPPRSALRPRSIVLRRCSRREPASRATRPPPSAGTSRRRRLEMRGPRTIWRSWTPSRSAEIPTTSRRPNGSAVAGQLGVRDSQFNLAILYARGLGVGQDLRQSWHVVLARRRAGRSGRRQETR